MRPPQERAHCERDSSVLTSAPCWVTLLPWHLPGRRPSALRSPRRRMGCSPELPARAVSRVRSSSDSTSPSCSSTSSNFTLMSSACAALRRFSHRAASGRRTPPCDGTRRDRGSPLVAEIIALLVCDERLEFRAPAVVPHRKETQEDNRQDVALVVRRLHRASKGNRGLKQLFR